MVFDIVELSAAFNVFLKYSTLVCVVAIFVLWTTGYLKSLIKTAYGFTEDGEQTKFSILSICYAFIIGVYWMLRVTKDPVFYQLVGISYVPKAKMITPFIQFIVLFLLSMIVDKVRRHRLFLIVSLIYGSIFATIAFFMKVGVPHFNFWLTNWIPGSSLGWIYYWSVETLGGIIVGAVFWAFVASTTKTESAKRGYPLITLGAQLGNLYGPAIVAASVLHLGQANMIFIITGLLMIIPIIIELYMSVVPAHLHESDDSGHGKKKKTGVWEGLRLIATKPFLIGVAVVSTIYEVVGTIIDFQFKNLAKIAFPVSEELATFFSFFAISSAFISLLFAMLGTGFIINRFGVKKSLLGYPSLLGFSILVLWANPGLLPFFIAMIVVKAGSYALNNPVKELLYLPTSKDVKTKAKGFIDGFGGKTSKGIGSLITDQLKGNVSSLLQYGSMISLGVVGIWIFVAFVVGTKYDQLIEEKEILE